MQARWRESTGARESENARVSPRVWESSWREWQNETVRESLWQCERVWVRVREFVESLRMQYDVGVRSTRVWERESPRAALRAWESSWLRMWECENAIRCESTGSTRVWERESGVRERESPPRTQPSGTAFRKISTTHCRVKNWRAWNEYETTTCGGRGSFYRHVVSHHEGGGGCHVDKIRKQNRKHHCENTRTTKNYNKSRSATQTKPWRLANNLNLIIVTPGVRKWRDTLWLDPLGRFSSDWLNKFHFKTRLRECVIR